MKRFNLPSLLLLTFVVSTRGVAAQPAPTNTTGAYLFVYFHNNGEDGLHLALSRDGFRFSAIGGGRSYLAPKVGEAKLMRDPCVLAGPDGTYHLVWTTSWGGKTIGYASSRDLVHWSEEQAIPVMAAEPDVENCWAPEIDYDAAKQEFIIFWSSTIKGRFPATLGTAEGNGNHRFYYTTTKDFVTFTPTKLLYDPGFVCIDATFLKAGDQLYLIFKDETLKPERKNLHIAEAASYEGPFTNLSPPFTRSWVEGPTALRVGDNYVVYFDCYRDGHFGAVRSRDMKHWEDISARVAFPDGARHGTVIAIPEPLFQSLHD